jgi:hypothetical protein
MMNKRIKELADEAKMSTYLLAYGVEFNISIEKFAELIVRECASLAYDGPGGILEHFGVNDNLIKVGSRIKVISGFNVGAKGTVSYIEPTGRMWVMRDGASSDVFYHPEEVIGVEE